MDRSYCRYFYTDYGSDCGFLDVNIERILIVKYYPIERFEINYDNLNTIIEDLTKEHFNGKTFTEDGMLYK